MQRDETQLLARIAELEAQNAELRKALESIAGTRCENYTTGLGSCHRQGRTDPWAPEGADQPCWPCVAHSALAIPTDATALDRVRAQAKAEAWEEAAKEAMAFAADHGNKAELYAAQGMTQDALIWSEKVSTAVRMAEVCVSRAAALRQEAQR